MKSKGLNILCLTGGDNKYHPHDEYGKEIENILSNEGHKIIVTEDHDYLYLENVKDFDVIISLSTNFYLTKDHEDGLLKAIIGNPWGKTGKPKGFIGLHAATSTYLNSLSYINMVGARLLTHPKIYKFKYCVSDKDHMIMNGVKDFSVESELYLMEVYPPFDVLLTCDYMGFKRPVAWTKPYGRGRVFYCALGHHPEEYQNENVKKMIVNAVNWSVQTD